MDYRLHRRGGPVWHGPAAAGLARSALEFFLDFCAFARGEGIKVAILVALGAILEGVGLVLLVPMLSVVVGGHDGWDRIVVRAARAFGHWAIASRIEELTLLLACFAVLVLLRAVVLWHRDVMLARLRIGFVEQQRTRLVARLVGAPWTQLSGMQHSRINHLLSSDIVLTGACAHFMLQGIVSFCMLAMQWFLAFLFSPLLAAVTGILLIGAGVALIPHLTKSRALGKDVAEANLHLATSGSQFLGGLKLAMSQNLQYRFAEEFNDTLGKLMLRQVAFVREQSRAQLAFATMSSLAGAAAIFFGIWLLGTPPSVLIVFVLVLARISAPAAQLQQGVQQVANFLPSYEKIRSLEAELQSEAIADIPACDLPRSGTVRFCNVSFCHPGGRKGVFDVDLAIEPGSFIGVMGASGAGKTTFADLLVGLIAPHGGTISVGGEVMTDELRRHWRSTIAYSPQEAFLFHDSIRNNLLWANPAAQEDDIQAALRVAGADAFVSRLEQGLDTIVGEKGMLLAGGERQRLTLARALLRKPPLLVLDETTNAIDIPSERAVLAELVVLTWRPSVVLIAHRMESLALCDRIVEFADGRIVSDRSLSQGEPLRANRDQSPEADRNSAQRFTRSAVGPGLAGSGAGT